jgi:hypothetical protein
MERLMITYSLTYEIVTPESAEGGDFAEHGWLTTNDMEIPLEDDEGYHRDALELAKEGCFERKGSLVDVIREVHNRGLRWVGNWFASVDPEVDFLNAEERTYALHVKGDAAAEAVRFAVEHDLQIL